MVFEVAGILAPVFTPMTDTGAVKLSVIPAYMEHLKKHRVDGILVGGTTGEGMSLDVEERKSLLEAWMSVARPLNTKVIAQVGGAPLPDVLELAKHAEKLNVDGIMALPELYYKPKTVDQLIGYLHKVSSAAPTLPLLYYHFPMMSGVNVNMKELFSSASSKLPNFKGAKADLDVAEQVAALLAQDQKIFIANHCFDISGLISPVFTPVDSEGALNLNVIPQYAQYLQDEGVNGILGLDMVEFWRLATQRIPTFKGIKSAVFETSLLLQDEVMDNQKIFIANSVYPRQQLRQPCQW
ncbi:hypothetical protein HF086_013589 [Spodoptera exigua]|uniref:N-acetylneuraminate lyase n=1 Tax=Spodoptera exigua TaxID=7107 RepID=A0A922MUE9_SPOEX|nr:hypothetical protein HF086_013589 [Spodoptera exigua]